MALTAKTVMYIRKLLYKDISNISQSCIMLFLNKILQF